jgi:hypothetical protein
LGNILNPILSDNGGPTLTHALVGGSPALDTTATAVCTPSPINDIDQRGAARNFDADASPGIDCDSGAVEFHESITVDSCSGTPLSGLQTFSFAASGQAVSVDIANGNGLTCWTAEEMGPGANHLLATGPGAGDPALLTNNWWHISGDVESGLDVAITLPYAAADADSRVCKWPGGLGGFGFAPGANFINHHKKMESKT